MRIQLFPRLVVALTAVVVARAAAADPLANVAVAVPEGFLPEQVLL